MKKLHIGCGEKYLDGWVNTDGYEEHGADLYFDFSKPFPLEGNSFDAIVSQHAIEHTNYAGGINFLKESFRVLKPGGKARISCPDLELVIKNYVKSKETKKLEYADTWDNWNKLDYRTACQHINEIISGWGHQYVYDFEDMEMKMREIGFVNIKKKSDTDMDPIFLNTENDRPETLYIEAEKPL